MNYSIRDMDLGDIPQVSQIEREAFPPPWPSTNFKHEIKSNKLARYFIAYQEVPGQREPAPEAAPANNPGSSVCAVKRWLSRLFGRKVEPVITSHFILGFAGLWFMAGEAHLANIAVREAFRRQGIGERLLITAIELAIESTARMFTLEVRVSNVMAQSLYRKYGLLEVGRRRGYYMDNKEDALIMTAEDITSASYTAKLQSLKQAHEKRWGLASSQGGGE